jgi:hypothetical protein
VPFIRQSRDKRGFEQTYVMHNGRPGTGQTRPRVLYVFRTPGNLKVGRRALDSEVREALEHTHPDLSFDWNALTREAVVARPEPAPPRPQKSRPSQVPHNPPPSHVPQPVPEDLSLLGTTLGAATAARLRTRFSEVSQRIARRSRTPEERDALLERARPLNPDSWADETTIRERAASIDSELDALASALPSRRRGRRGGRHRTEQAQGRDTGPVGASGIMADDGDRLENPNDPSMDRPAGASDSGGSDGLGAAGAEAGDIQIDD